jgi:ATP-dependent Clp protease ATP-binding subunit ClpA
VNEREAISRSPESRAAFDRASQIAQEADTPVTAVQHLLAALLEIESGNIRRLLGELNVDVDALCQAAAALPVPSVVQPEAGLLDKYGVDLTQQARDGKLPETIGRKDEMLQVVRALGRDTKNNPVLIGEAGVGKTAIVEGLATSTLISTISASFRSTPPT